MYRDGYIVGTGAAQDVEVGFIPSYVRVINVQSRALIVESTLRDVHGFTGGGPKELKAGMLLTSANGAASGIIEQVLVTGGSFAGGNASGSIVIRPGTERGTFPAGAAGATEYVDVPVTTDDVTIVTPRRETSIQIAAAAGAATTNTNIRPYYGGTAVPRERSAGFTIQSALSLDNELIFWQAWGD